MSTISSRRSSIGVRGYIPTSLEPSEAAAALQCVEAGGTFVPASAMIKFAQDRQNGPGPSVEHETSALRRLTPRESEVLARLRQGKPNKIIAHELQITENTVKVFVRRILMKLDASNRTEVACQRRAGTGLGLAARSWGWLTIRERSADQGSEPGRRPRLTPQVQAEPPVWRPWYALARRSKREVCQFRHIDVEGCGLGERGHGRIDARNADRGRD